MKLSWGAVFSMLYCSASASAMGIGHVYLRDPTSKASPQAPSTVDPQTARLIFAQRLGLSRFHAIPNAREKVIQQINAFGGKPKKLFGGDDTESSKAQVLIWLDDVEDPSEIIKDPATFTISQPPASADNERLIQDMILQAESLPAYPDPKARTHKAVVEADSVLSLFGKPTLHNEYLNVFHATKDDQFSRAELSKQVAHLFEEAERVGLSMTVVLMPTNAIRSKRSLPYGTYGMPSISESRQNAEAFLSPGVSKPSAAPKVDVSDLEDFPVISQAQADEGPVLGILPRCFSTQSECETQTKNCSSHGECKLLHKGQQGKSTDCYSCACVPTVKHVEHGMETKRQVTYWGGPACQKQDVSTPFWLFVGAGVGLAFLISTAIGMLYSVGSEELPSVIGAGVSGPVRK